MQMFNIRTHLASFMLMFDQLLISTLSLTGIYDGRHIFHLEAAALHLQPLQLRTFLVALKI